MTDWTLLALDTPLAGSAQRSELSMASGRSLSFNLGTPDTLTFSLPARHWQTSLVEPLVTDVLAYREDWCVQRFRVITAAYAKQSGQYTANFTAISYDGLLDSWIFTHLDRLRWYGTETGSGTITASNNYVTYAGAHGLSAGQMVTLDPLGSFYVHTVVSGTQVLVTAHAGGAVYDWAADDTFTWSAKATDEQTAVAWEILNAGQTKPQGTMGITRGTLPASGVYRIYDGNYEDEVVGPHFFRPGTRRGEAINSIAAMADGFEWTIEPDRTSVTTELSSLKFNTWNLGGRKNHTPRCPMVLDDGGNVASWMKNTDPKDYANVIYAEGNWPSSLATIPEDLYPRAIVPSTGNPAGTVAVGRWERFHSFEMVSGVTVEAAAQGELTRSLGYQPAWSMTLANGRWEGPADMWVGDYCRAIVNDGPVTLDADVRVVGLNIGLTEAGMESVSVALDKPTSTYAEFRAELERRLLNLERR